jgi:hypothetical protein
VTIDPLEKLPEMTKEGKPLFWMMANDSKYVGVKPFTSESDKVAVLKIVAPSPDFPLAIATPTRCSSGSHRPGRENILLAL